MKKALRLLFLGLALPVSVLSLVSFSSAAPEGYLGNIVKEKCMVCHTVNSEGKVSRIDYVRKTPEGFEATVNRMQRLWGLKLTDEEKRQVIKDLSQARPLAPAETEKIMYLLTGEHGTIEQVPNETVKAACTRCHSFARVAAQRRTKEEWMKLKDTHMALNPALILQTRDTDWPKIATEALNWLAEKYPADTQEYREWRAAGSPRAIDGKWQVVGYQPGKGKYFGTVEFAGQGNGEYRETRNITYADGSESKWEGTGRLYSGYSLRSSLISGEEKAKGVLLLQGDVFRGKWHSLKDAGISGEETYYREGAGAAKVTDVFPAALRRGTTATLTIRGVNLPAAIKPGDINLAGGVTVKKVVSASANAVTVEVAVGQGPDLRGDVKAGSALGKGLVTVFDKVDYLKITPEYAVARLGGGGRDKEGVQFQALGYSNGADGKAGTGDDLSVGPLEGVQWSVKEFVNAPGDDEIKWIGSLDQQGYFTPAIDGPNPQRPMATNNAGAVTVVGKYQPPGGGKPVAGEAKLLVTVPVYRAVE